MANAAAISPEQAYEQAKAELLANKQMKMDSFGGGASMGTVGANAVYGCIKDDASKFSKAYPCHRYLQLCDHAQALWSVFKTSPKNMLVQQRQFFSWLLNGSPWAKSGRLFPKLETEDFYFENGFVFGLDYLKKTPSNVIHNFLVAARGVREWPYNIDTWARFVTDFGIDPTVAYIFAGIWTMTDDFEDYKTRDYSTAKFRHKAENKYDWPFDAATSDKTYWLNFLSGRMVKKNFNQPFYPNASNPPINNIWGQQYEGYFFKNVILPVLEKYGRGEKIEDRFSRSTRMEYTWSWPEAVAATLAAQKMLFDMLKEKSA